MVSGLLLHAAPITLSNPPVCLQSMRQLGQNRLVYKCLWITCLAQINACLCVSNVGFVNMIPAVNFCPGVTLYYIWKYQQRAAFTAERRFWFDFFMNGHSLLDWWPPLSHPFLRHILPPYFWISVMVKPQHLFYSNLGLVKDLVKVIWALASVWREWYHHLAWVVKSQVQIGQAAVSARH